jgi:hypothetical protein
MFVLPMQVKQETARMPAKETLEALRCLQVPKTDIAQCFTQQQADALLETLIQKVPIPEHNKRTELQVTTLISLYNQANVVEWERDIPETKDMCTIVIHSLIMQANARKEAEPPSNKQLMMLASRNVHVVPKTKAAASCLIEALLKNEARTAVRLPNL